MTTILSIVVTIIVVGVVPSVNIPFLFIGLIIAVGAYIITVLRTEENQTPNKQNESYHAFIASVVYVVYAILMGLVSDGYDFIAVTRRSFFYGAIIMLVVNLVLHRKIALLTYVKSIFARLFNPGVLINTLVLGAIASALCFAFWQHATIEIGTISTNLLLAVTPVGTSL
ncbi:hypothetical protein FACS1894200_02160 [Spirochaetia bacterium]|nr:hypothetical protein FACS1894200_02160 [Spirochaetia bacterium]